MQNFDLAQWQALAFCSGYKRCRFAAYVAIEMAVEGERGGGALRGFWIINY